jgi:hypothetical protein
MARRRPESAYRELGVRDEASRKGRIDAWMETLAPGALAFAQDTRLHASESPRMPMDAPSPDALAEVARSRTVAKKTAPSRFTPRFAAALVALSLVLVLISVWVPASARPESADFLAYLVVWPVFLGGMILAAVVFQVWRAQTLTRRLHRAKLEAARGNVEPAEADLRALSRGMLDSVASQAFLALAQLAEQRADWASVVASCDQGIARASRQRAVRDASSDLLIPELVSLRAMALAALGKAAESRAELAVLTVQFPTFPHTARGVFRARLVQAVTLGDLDAAAEVALGRSLELPLSIRDDMLADLVLATTRGASDQELERIDGEFRDDARLLAWIDRTAPALRRRPRVRVAVAREASADEAAAVEAHGEDEAEEERDEEPPRAKSLVH